MDRPKSRIDLTHRDRAPGGKPCLHCALREAVIAFYRANGAKGPDGAPIVDAQDIVSAAVELVASLVFQAPDRTQRRIGQRFAREALEAAFRYETTGQRQIVEYGQGTEH